MSILVALVGLVHSIVEKRPAQWQKWQNYLWRLYGYWLVVDFVLCILFAALVTL